MSALVLWGVPLLVIGLLVIGAALTAARTVSSRQRHTGGDAPIIPVNLASVNDGVLVAHLGGRIVFANEVVREWFGIDGDDPDLWSLAQQVRPAESFLELFAAEGQAAFAVNERKVDAVSHQVAVGEATQLIVVLREETLPPPLSREERGSPLAFKVLSEVGQAINASLDLDSTLQAAVQGVRRLLPCDVVQVCLLDSDKSLLKIAVHDGPPLHLAGFVEADNAYRLEEGYPGRVARGREPLLVADLAAEVPASSGPLNGSRPQGSFLAVPLAAQGRVIGTLNLFAARPDSFTQDDVSVLAMVGDQAAVAIENARQYREQAARVAELSGLQKIASAIGTLGDPPRLFARLGQHVAELMGTEMCGVLLYDRESERLVAQKPMYGVLDTIAAEYTISLAKGSPARGLWEDVPFWFSNDVASDDLVRELGLGQLVELAGLRATALATMSVGESRIGVLQVGNKLDESPFTIEDTRLLQTYADQAAIIVESTRLYDEEQSRVAELQGLQQIVQTLGSFADPEELYDQLTSRIADLIGVEVCGFLIHEAGQLVARWPFYGVEEPVVRGVRIPVDKPGLARDIWRESEVFATNQVFSEAAIDDLGLRDLARAVQLRTLILAPLNAAGRRFGFLQVGNKADGGDFDDADKRLVTIFAGQAAALLDNARLYQDTDATLRRRAAELRSLSRVNRELNATLDLERILEVIAAESLRAEGAVWGSLVMVEWDEGGTRMIPHRRYGGQLGEEAQVLELASARGGEILLIDDFQKVGHYPSPIPEARCALIVPIRYEDKTAGVISLYGDRPGALGANAAEYVQALSSQATIAITNADRHAEEKARGDLLKQRADQLTQIVELGRAFRSDQSIRQNLASVAASIKESVGFDRVLVSALDEGRALLMHLAFAGFPDEEADRLAGQPARWGAVEDCLDGDSRVGDAYLVPAADGEALRGALGLSPEDDSGDLLLVPLYSSGGGPMGTLLVDQPVDGQAPTPDTVELLQIFANQAAVVIENSRLYSSMEARAEELSHSLENLERSYEELDRLSHEMIRKDVELSQANDLLNLRAQRLLALHRVMESVDTTQDTGTVLQEIVSAVVREMDVDHCLLFLGEEGRPQPLHVAASAGPLPARSKLEALLDGDDPVSRAFKNREAVVFQLDEAGDGSAAQLARALGAYALIALSFQLEPSLTGVLLVGSAREGMPFSGEDRDLLNLLASQITVEYENARLYQVVQSEAASAAGERDRLQQLHMTTTTLQQTDNVEERLNVIVRGLRAVGWDRVAISLIDENLDSFKLIAEGYSPEQRKALVESLASGAEWRERLDDDLFCSTQMGMCYYLAHDHPWVQKHGEAVDPAEVSEDYGPDDWHPGDQLYLPMYAGGEIIGWTILRDPASGKRPDQASMRPIELFVRQASSALENARLYQETLDLKSYNEAVVQSIQQGIVVTDAKGTIESFNAFIRDQYAWPEKAVGQNLFKVQPQLAVVEADLAMVARDKQPAEKSGVQYLVADEVHTLNIYLYPRYDESQAMTGVVILIEDVTQRTRLEADMALRGQQLAALSEVSRQITATLSVDHVVGNALDQAREVIHYDRVVLWLRDMEHDTLAMVGVRGYVDDTATLEPVIRVDDSPLLAEVVRGKLPVSIGDRREDARTVEQSLVTMRTWLGLPLISGGEAIGVIVFERIDPHAYAPADTQVAAAFANQIAVALENARLYEEAKQQAQELHSRTSRLAQLNSISNVFGRSLDQQSIMQTAVDVMAQTLEMAQGSVIVFDHTSHVGELTIQHPSNPDGSVETIQLKIDGNPAFEHLCGSKTPLVVSDVSTDPVMAEMQPFLKARNVKSILMTPLVVGNEVIGSIALEETKAPRSFEAEHVELAQTITNQAAVAVQNARLFQETVSRRAELSILFEAGRIASSSLDLYNVVHNAARYYVRAMDVTSATISMWDPEADSLVTLVEFSKSTGTRPLNELASRSGLDRYPVALGAIEEQEPDVLAATRSDLTEAEAEWLKRLDAASMLVIPLVTREETIGLVELAVAEAGRDFDEREMRLARALSASVATAMENARLHDETQKRLNELSEINKISRMLAQTISAEDLFRMLHEQISRVIDADSLTVAQHEPKKDRLVFPCVIRSGLRVPVEPVAYGGDLYSYVIDSREPLLIGHDLEQTLKDLSLTHAEPGLKAFMGVPLISGEKVIGVLTVEDYEQEGRFNEADLRVLGPIAAQVSVSVENARLYGELEQRLSETTTLQEVSRVVNSALDLQEIFERVVSELANAFRYPLLGLYTLEGRELALQAYHGYSEEVVEKLRRVKVDGEILGRSIIQKEPIFVENVQEDPDYEPVLDWVTSMIVVPVLSDEFILGVLAVQSGADKPLTENDLQLLRTFAGQVSTAMVNASLYAQMVELSEELERRVEERTRELREERDRIDTLFRITVELTASLDLDRVLNRALELVAEAVGAEHGSLYLVDPQSEMLIHRAVMSAQQLLPPGGRQIPLSRHEGMAGWVMDNRESIVVDNVQVDPRWVNVPGTEHNRSLLGAPLIANEEVLGCIFFTSDRLNAFHEGHVRLVEAAANQVATSINNAELYRLIRDQAERLGTMLRSQQTEAAKSQAILESIADGVMVSDQTGEVILFNAASERILGLRRDEVLGRPTTEMVGVYGAGAERWAEMLSEWGKDPSAHRGTFLSEQIEVGEKIVSVHVSPVAHGDELLGLVSVFRDITREVMADRIKTEFVSNVSHELRTPMTSIKGYADLLLLGAAGEITAEQRRFLEIVKSNADRLSLLVNDLLDISRIEQGRVQLDLLDVDLHELVEGVIDVIEGRKENDGRSIELMVDIPGDLPTIQADYDRITQVVTNLVSNAYQYTPDDGTVTVKVSPEDEGVRIDVIDTGIGISEEDQARIFERFFRGEDPMVMRAAGTGLGLSIVQHLVEMHHGNISFTSKLNEGTTFSVRLPYVVKRKADYREPAQQA